MKYAEQEKSPILRAEKSMKEREILDFERDSELSKVDRTRSVSQTAGANLVN
jgi:hypothetical protein